VPLTALEQRVLGKHILDRAAQRLAALEDEQDRLERVQGADDQIRGSQRASVAFSVLPSQRPSGIFARGSRFRLPTRLCAGKSPSLLCAESAARRRSLLSLERPRACERFGDQT
jgi:hypothetical protein